MSILDGGLIYPKFVFQQAIDDVFTALTLRLRNPENSNVKTARVPLQVEDLDCKVLTRAAIRSVSLFWAVKSRSISPTPDSHEFIRSDSKSRVLITSLISLEFLSTSGSNFVSLVSRTFWLANTWSNFSAMPSRDCLFCMRAWRTNAWKSSSGLLWSPAAAFAGAALRSAADCSRVMRLAASSWSLMPRVQSRLIGHGIRPANMWCRVAKFSTQEQDKQASDNKIYPNIMLIRTQNGSYNPTVRSPCIHKHVQFICRALTVP